MATAKVSVRVKNAQDDLSDQKQTDDSVVEGSEKPIASVIDLTTNSSSQTTQIPPENSEITASNYDSQYNTSSNSMRSYSNGEERMTSSGRDVPTQKVSGILDISQDGHGFLRPNFRPSDEDVYISASQIRRFSLRGGDMIEGMGRPPKESERYFGLLKVEKVNGIEAEKQGKRIRFEELTPIYPDEKLKLETGKTPLSTRIIDLISPIGMGQRGMVVSPPKAGKTTILKDIARGISENYPKIHLMAALIGERPEEVTDISRSVKGEVIASNFY